MSVYVVYYLSSMKFNSIDDFYAVIYSRSFDWYHKKHSLTKCD